MARAAAVAAAILLVGVEAGRVMAEPPGHADSLPGQPGAPQGPQELSVTPHPLLDRKVLGLALKDASLKDAVRAIGRAASVELTVDWRALEEQLHLDCELQKVSAWLDGVTVEDALLQLLDRGQIESLMPVVVPSSDGARLIIGAVSCAQLHEMYFNGEHGTAEERDALEQIRQAPGSISLVTAARDILIRHYARGTPVEPNSADELDEARQLVPASWQWKWLSFQVRFGLSQDQINAFVREAINAGDDRGDDPRWKTRWVGELPTDHPTDALIALARRAGFSVLIDSGARETMDEMSEQNGRFQITGADGKTCGELFKEVLSRLNGGLMWNHRSRLTFERKGNWVVVMRHAERVRHESYWRWYPIDWSKPSWTSLTSPQNVYSDAPAADTVMELLRQIVGEPEDWDINGGTLLTTTSFETGFLMHGLKEHHETTRRLLDAVTLPAGAAPVVVRGPEPDWAALSRAMTLIEPEPATLRVSEILGRVGQQIGIAIEADWPTLEEWGVLPDESVDIAAGRRSALDVLRALLPESASVEMVPRDGKLMLTSCYAASLSDTSRQVIVYDVSHLIPAGADRNQAMEQLQDEIRRHYGEENGWDLNGGTWYALTHVGGKLILTGPPMFQYQLMQVLTPRKKEAVLSRALSPE